MNYCFVNDRYYAVLCFSVLRLYECDDAASIVCQVDISGDCSVESCHHSVF